MHNNKVDFVKNLCSFVLNPLNFYLLCWHHGDDGSAERALVL
jgi:hypothetical protein